MDEPCTQGERQTLIENARLGSPMLNLALRVVWSLTDDRHASYSAIARRMEVHRSTAMRHVRTLFELGVLRVRPRFRARSGGQDTNAYTIDWDRLADLQLDDRGRRGPRNVSSRFETLGLFETPPEPELELDARGSATSGGGGRDKLSLGGAEGMDERAPTDGVANCDPALRGEKHGVANCDPVAECDPSSENGRRENSPPKPPPPGGEEGPTPPKGLAGPPEPARSTIDKGLFTAGVRDAENRLQIIRTPDPRGQTITEAAAETLLAVCGFDELTAGEVAFFWRPARIQSVVRYAVGQLRGGIEIRSLRAWMARLLSHRDYLGADELFEVRVGSETDRFQHACGALHRMFGGTRSSRAPPKSRRR